jgi:hypothetical protein
MTQLCFNRDEECLRTWFLDYSPGRFDHEFFDTKNANLAVRILKDKYDINAKKVLRFGKNRGDMFPYNVKISFYNDEDEAFFIVKVSNGIEIDGLY